MNPFQCDFRKLEALCNQHDVTMIGIFGSTVRGEEKEDSDLDMLVKFSKRKSLLALIRLERELSDQIGRKVDLLTEGGISPYLRKSIEDDLMVIYEA